MSTVYLIRHGQASFGSENYDILSDLGKKQARITGLFLDKTGVVFDAIYSGKMERQFSTAEIIHENLFKSFSEKQSVIKAENLEEYNSKDIFLYYIPVIEKETGEKIDQKKLFTDKRYFQHIFQDAMTRWYNEADKNLPFETRTAFLKRITSSIHGILKENHSDRNIIIVTSGGVISTFIQSVLNLDNETTLHLAWQVANASISAFKYSKDRITLHYFNNYHHLINQGKENVSFR